MVAHSDHCGEAIWLDTADPRINSVELVGFETKTRRLLAHG